MIEMRSVRFMYGAAEDGLQPFSLSVDNLSVAPGQRVACIGPSGAGKSTLINLMAGCLVAHGGSVRVLGKELSAMGERHRRRMRLCEIGLVFQELELLEYLTSYENIELASTLGASLAGVKVADRVASLAAAAGITHTLNRRPAQLSQGERQRVAVCRALLPAPRLVLCDEPTGNLDPQSTIAVTELLLDECRRVGAAVVMITHNHGLLGRFDRVIEVVRDSDGASVRDHRPVWPSEGQT